MKEKENKPLVSVLMPTYNHEAFIAESIDSVLAQDYENMEIIIVDDASIDNTPEIIREYEKKYPGLFKIIINPKNLGVTPTCNIAISKCSGKYVAFSSGDDLWFPKKLNKQIVEMEKISNCILSYHDVEVFNSDNDRTIRYWNSGSKGARGYEGNCVKISKLLVEEGTGFMAALSVVVQRHRIPQKGFDDRVRVASDWLMWIDILAGGPGLVKFIPEVLARYRRHDNNVSNRENKEDANISLAIVESSYPWLVKSVRIGRGRLYYSRAVRQIRKGNKRLGRYFLFYGILYCGVSKLMYLWKSLLWCIISFIPDKHLKTIINIDQNS